MLKIITKRFSALILSAAIMFSAAAVIGYAEEADSKSKITDKLSQKIEEDFFDGEITAVLNIKITDDVNFATDDYTPFSSYVEEHSNDGLSENELYTKWLSEAYRFDSFKVGYELYLYDFVKRKGIEEYLPQFRYGDMFPSIYIKLPQKDFYELIKDDEIFRVDYWDTTLGMLPEVGYWFSYSSDDALRILRASVGLEEKHWSKLYDVNGDKKLDSSDALLALRESVHLEMVFEGYKAKLFPLYNVEKYGYIDERYQIAY